MFIFPWFHVLSKAATRRGFFAAIAAAALPLFLGACTTSQPLPVPGAAWKTQTGQLLYRGPKDRSVIGEVVVRYSSRTEFALSFLSGPGFPLLKLQVNGDDVVAEGVLARGRWRGKVDKAPKTLQGWIALREVFARLPNSYSQAGWAAKVESTSNRITRIDARFAPTGERFAFHFGS